MLLLTDDPSLIATTIRLADSVGIGVRQTGDIGDTGGETFGPGLPALVLLGADRPADPALPPQAAGVARILLSADQPSAQLWQSALEVRAEQVVLLPEAEHALLDRLTRLADQRPHQALVIAVAGGCGGAGASVLAAALARAATAVTLSLLIDVDRMSGGADLLLGAEDEPGLRWPDLASARGRLLPGSLVGALPVVDGLHVLSWDRSPAVPPELIATAGSAVFDAAGREYGAVVLDLPRYLDEVGRAASRTADLGLLVVPAEVRAVAAAARALTELQQYLADVRLVVRGPGPTGLRGEEIADVLELPLAGWLSPEPGLRAALDRGEPPGLRSRGPLSQLCRGLLAQILADRAHDRGRA